jgi:uncharacterized protein YfkK (UPF0435 family)
MLGGTLKEAEKIIFSYTNTDINSISLIWGFIKNVSVFSVGEMTKLSFKKRFLYKY